MNSSTDEDTVLSLEEFGMLCFTNSYYLEDDLSNHMEVVMTSRQSYFWVPLLSHLIKSTNLKIEDIKVFIELSLNSLVTKNETRWNNRVLGVGAMLSTLESVLFYSTRLKFNNPTLEDEKLIGDLIDDALLRLENHNLVEDHNIKMFNGSSGVMMGLLPLSFTKRTQIGEEIYLKFNNKFRKMELQKEIKGSPYEEHYKFHLIWEIFKTSIFTMEDVYGSSKKKRKFTTNKF